ncbi:hypothetical protein CPB83DRAFT_889926 [Crepidotus variabilis]|uniref:Uncharacterized protein n=1 Tax=Crepidotus variabilis TaxID=179855 RepID=A0A9P6EQB2_9AGAR|nr:hypothetical protein CPB83DRAFT_889926 [Crepidotus variabilis]
MSETLCASPIFTNLFIVVATVTTLFPISIPNSISASTVQKDEAIIPVVIDGPLNPLLPFALHDYPSRHHRTQGTPPQSLRPLTTIVSGRLSTRAKENPESKHVVWEGLAEKICIPPRRKAAATTM